jgi:hypothetical protein
VNNIIYNSPTNNDTSSSLSGANADSSQSSSTGFTFEEKIASLSAVCLVVFVGITICVMLVFRRRRYLAHKKEFALKPLVLQYPTQYVEPKKTILARLPKLSKSGKNVLDGEIFPPYSYCTIF